MGSKCVLAAGVAIILASGSALAESVDLTSDRDNTIYLDGLPLSNGAGQHMFAGNSGNGLPRRALIRFDVAGSVPAGATIDSVTLTLNMSRTNIGPRNNALHRLVADWGEAGSIAFGEEGGGALAMPGDATWEQNFYDANAPQLWATQGGDFVAASSASIIVDQEGLYTWGSTTEMVADIQMWLDDPASNYGWIIIGGESGFGGAKRYDTHDNIDPLVHPVLTVMYSMGSPADLNGDGFVNGADLAALLAAWGPCAGCPADLNGDGDVNGSDLAALLAAWT